MSTTLGVLLVAALTAPAPTEEAAEETVGAVITRYEREFAAWVREVSAATGEEQRRLVEARPRTEAFADELAAIVEAGAAAEDAIEAAMWTYAQVEDEVRKERALEVLVGRHVDHPAVGTVALVLAQAPDRLAEGALRRLRESADETVRACATFGHVQWLARAGEGDPEEHAAQLARIAAEHGDLPHPRRGTLGAAAEALRFEVEHLAVGRVAPDIEGEDLDGSPLKLSDYRGKVVLLSYWAHW